MKDGEIRNLVRSSSETWFNDVAISDGAAKLLLPKFRHLSEMKVLFALCSCDFVSHNLVKLNETALKRLSEVCGLSVSSVNSGVSALVRSGALVSVSHVREFGVDYPVSETYMLSPDLFLVPIYDQFASSIGVETETLVKSGRKVIKNNTAVID